MLVHLPLEDAYPCEPPATQPTEAGSEAGLEAMPIDSVTRSDGNSPGERAPPADMHPPTDQAQVERRQRRSG
jgi:hypothetical protein